MMGANADTTPGFEDIAAKYGWYLDGSSNYNNEMWDCWYYDRVLNAEGRIMISMLRSPGKDHYDDPNRAVVVYDGPSGRSEVWSGQVGNEVELAGMQRAIDAFVTLLKSR